MSVDGNEPVPTTVTALLGEVRRMLDEERGHGEAIDTRLGQLTGFVGIILTLITPLGAEHLGEGNGTLFDLFYVGSVLLLAGSALLAVTVGMRTRTVKIGEEELRVPWRHRIGVEKEALERFGGEFTGESTVVLEKRLINATIETIKDQRDLNGRKAELVRQVSFGTAVALLGVGAQALILTM